MHRLRVAVLALSVATALGCHHDKYGLKATHAEEMKLPPNEPRFDNAPESEYKAPPKKKEFNPSIGGGPGGIGGSGGFNGGTTPGDRVGKSPHRHILPNRPSESKRNAANPFPLASRLQRRPMADSNGVRIRTGDHAMYRLVYALFAVITIGNSPLLAQRLRDRLAPPPTETLQSANDILADLAKIPDKSIPPKLLQDAHGVAIIPHIVKAGFVIAGSGGHGLVLAKDKDGKWGEPIFLNFGGGSVGFQVGVESIDAVLVFRDRKSLDRLLEGKGKVTLGADAAIAAGPVGRQVKAATDGKLEAEIVSYSRSRGLFGGIALEGGVLNPDEKSNASYKADTRLETAKKVTELKNALTTMSKETPAAVVPTPVVPARP